MDVSISEFRRDMKKWIDRAREGHEVRVTDRGRPVVKVVPAGETPRERLIREGYVKPKRRTLDASTVKRVRAKGSVSEILAEIRG